MSSENPVQYGNVKASYFWDDGSGINGDTGAPASGKPMQEGLAASPSWPLGTEGYVEYNGKKEEFFIGDRGPGDPAEGCNVLLDLDGKTFAKLTGESWNDDSYTVTGGQGHIDVEYYITKWGDGAGTPGAPQPMSGSEVCDDAVSPIPASAKKDDGGEEKKESQGDQGEKQQAKDGSKDESEEQSADEGSSGKGEDSEEQQAAPSGKNDGGDGSGQGLTAETAANDTSGIALAGDDLPMAAGLLTLAIVPALLVAFLFGRRRTATDYATEGGRHRADSLLTAEGLRETMQSVRDRLPGSWTEAKATAGEYWTRVRDRRSGSQGGE
ncbi:hypothetical protein HNR12_005038 [Streptomonospora nanhaiensis]|uniref:Uncharacterized protein n=1 Tax=Streptomonospora nanhaiensis TaxID=1323731 RepID=A0A853BWA5_9ACTN|nr:hypothetical protein [Streptomonospora nanhaiensis]NYI98761.1 hypothetical protein [Streptomonospora nanhaiensis]